MAVFRRKIIFQWMAREKNTKKKLKTTRLPISSSLLRCEGGPSPVEKTNPSPRPYAVPFLAGPTPLALSIAHASPAPR